MPEAPREPAPQVRKQEVCQPAAEPEVRAFLRELKAACRRFLAAQAEGKR